MNKIVKPKDKHLGVKEHIYLCNQYVVPSSNYHWRKYMQAFGPSVSSIGIHFFGVNLWYVH